MQNLKELLKYLDIPVIRYQIVKDEAHGKRIPDFLLWWLFSTHCNAATLGCAHRGSYTTTSPALAHSYPKPISRKLQKGTHYTVPAAIAGDGYVGISLLWELRFSKAEGASPAWNQCSSTFVSDPHISLYLRPGPLLALFSALFKAGPTPPV